MSLESFADLTYPGGKKPRRGGPTPSTPAEVEVPAWDAKPVYKIGKTGQLELFPIGALAQALGRASVTMRLWEREGILPTPSYRLTEKGGVKGRRYYTRAQIEGIQRIAQEEGLLGTRGPLTKDFSAKCHALFAELKKKGSTS